MVNATFAHAVSKCGIYHVCYRCKLEFVLYLPHWQTWVNPNFHAVSFEWNNKSLYLSEDKQEQFFINWKYFLQYHLASIPFVKNGVQGANISRRSLSFSMAITVLESYYGFSKDWMWRQRLWFLRFVEWSSHQQRIPASSRYSDAPSHYMHVSNTPINIESGVERKVLRWLATMQGPT